jgi:molybdate transport system substrate-binding protein
MPGLQTFSLSGLLLALSLAGPALGKAKHSLVVFSAASAAAAVEDIAADFSRRTGVKVLVSAAASSVLARQIAAGARADIYIAASPDWMAWAREKNLILPSTRRVLMSNRLVLAAPIGSTLPDNLAQALDQAASRGRIAMGDPDHVPVGQYGEAALRHLGLWRRLQSRLARMPNSVAAIALIARREVPAGIVYATDVRLAKSIRAVAAFPRQSHPPIRYQVALIRGQDHPAGARFLAVLLGPDGQRKFKARGFEPRRAH